MLKTKTLVPKNFVGFIGRYRGTLHIGDSGYNIMFPVDYGDLLQAWTAFQDRAELPAELPVANKGVDLAQS